MCVSFNLNVLLLLCRHFLFSCLSVFLSLFFVRASSYSNQGDSVYSLCFCCCCCCALLTRSWHFINFLVSVFYDMVLALMVLLLFPISISCICPFLLITHCHNLFLSTNEIQCAVILCAAVQYAYIQAYYYYFFLFSSGLQIIYNFFRTNNKAAATATKQL